MRIILIVATALLLAGQNTGKLALEGLVVTGAGEMVAGAQVRLVHSLTGQVPADRVGAQAVTDAEGRFAFRDLDPDRYTVIVAATGYVTQAYGAPLGSQDSAEAIDPASLGPSERIVVRLVGDGVITGRVTSQNGQPLAGIEIAAFSRAFDAYGWPLLRREEVLTHTDDRGEYRLIGMSPGQYCIFARTSSIGLIQDLALRTNVEGASLLPGNVRVPMPRSPGFFAPTFFPAAADSARATMVTVKPGSELRDINIVLTRQNSYVVSGRVVDPTTGAPIPSVTMRSIPISTEIPALGHPVAYSPDGSFEMQDVVPGVHWITAQLLAQRLRPRGGALVRLTDKDVTGVEIRLLRDFTIEGTIRIEGVPAGSLGGMVDLTPQLVPVNAFTDSGLGTVQLRADATFSIRDLIGAHYQFMLSGLPPEMYIHQARLGDIDLLAERPMLTEPPGTTLDIYLGWGRQVTGRVHNGLGRPAAGVTVVLIPEEGLVRRHLYKSAVSGAGGEFVMSGVAPGNYKAYAWEKLEPYKYFDEAFVREFQDNAVPLHVNDARLDNVELAF